MLLEDPKNGGGLKQGREWKEEVSKCWKNKLQTFVLRLTTIREKFNKTKRQNAGDETKQQQNKLWQQQQGKPSQWRKK